MTSGIWISTTAQILGVLVAITVLGGIVFAVGKFAERTTNGITTELRHLNASVDALREDSQALVALVHNHAERLSRIEGWRERSGF